jgi:hypothetical protein
MVTSNEKYEEEIFDSYQEERQSMYLQPAIQKFMEDASYKFASAYASVYSEVRSRNVSYKDLAEIAIDTLSDLELYELTAILNKHQKEKYEQEKDILGQ